jgi:hypothetical protein
MMTFDRAYVEKKDYAQASDDIGQFMTKHNIGGHWVRIRDLFASNPDHPAIGFQFTSVSENPFAGDWNEEKEDYDPVDWSEAYSVYDELAASGIETRRAIDSEAGVAAKP